MLVLTRQKLPVFDRRRVAGAESLYRGAYVISPEEGSSPDLILIASGSEVQLALSTQEKLQEEDLDARVVSMPSWELFRQQPASYRDEVLPPEVKARLAIEAASPMGWREWIGDRGRVLGITKFGASAPYRENFEHYGFTVNHIVNSAKEIQVETL